MSRNVSAPHQFRAWQKYEEAPINSELGRNMRVPHIFRLAKIHEGAPLIQS